MSAENLSSVVTCMSCWMVGSMILGTWPVDWVTSDLVTGGPGVIGFVVKDGASFLNTIVPFLFPYSPMTMGLESGWGAVRKA